jgi:type VI secretion system protein ImpK
VTLAAPVLDLILKIRGGLVTPSIDLRPSVDSLLDQMEQRASLLRCGPEEVKAVKFALAAFVDETVLTAEFSLREQWERFPLQLKYFGEHLAGVKYFERLDQLLNSIETNADVVEVYYLCMLLGYKGKYKVYLEEQLKGVIQNTADQLRRVGRLQEGELAPHWNVKDQPDPPADTSVPIWIIAGQIGVILVVVMIFMVLYLVLSRDVNSAVQQLQR